MLRTTLLLLVFLSFTLVSFAEDDKKDDEKLSENDVPAQVKQACQAKFPEGELKGWEKDGDNFEAEFKLNNQNYEAVFTPEGDWVKTENELLGAGVPETIMEAFKNSKYKDYEIADKEVVQTPEHDILFEIEVEMDGKEYGLHYTPDGKLVFVEGD